MPNYADGKIYKIICDKSDLIYIGSTCQTLANRLSQHKNKNNFKCSSKELFKLGNCSIILLEKFPCKDKEELTAREQYYLDQFKDKCINNRDAHCSIGISYKNNKKAYFKQYYITKQHEYKDYYENNKDKIKQIYVNNKDKLNQKNTCICGGNYTTANKTNHENTKKHIEFMKSKNI